MTCLFSDGCCSLGSHQGAKEAGSHCKHHPLWLFLPLTLLSKMFARSLHDFGLDAGLALCEAQRWLKILLVPILSHELSKGGAFAQRPAL